MSRLFVCLAVLGISGSNGCTTGERYSPYTTIPTVHTRDTYAAQRLNAAGLKAIEEGDYEAAEGRFREALDNDLLYAAAHNNLGLLLLRTDRPYDAAWEFQFAVKLMPSAAEPRNNLGLVMESVGRLSDAIVHYQEALDIDPDNIEIMGHLARTWVKHHEEPKDLRKLLKELALRGNETPWGDWAQRQLLTDADE